MMYLPYTLYLPTIAQYKYQRKILWKWSSSWKVVANWDFWLKELWAKYKAVPKIYGASKRGHPSMSCLLMCMEFISVGAMNNVYNFCIGTYLVHSTHTSSPNITQSLHRSHLNKGCTHPLEYGYNLVNAILRPLMDFRTMKMILGSQNWQDYISNGCVHCTSFIQVRSVYQRIDIWTRCI